MEIESSGQTLSGCTNGVREGFNKKNWENSHSLVGAPPPPQPPLKAGKQFYLLFEIWGLKRVLMQRIFIFWWGQLGKIGRIGHP